MEKRLKPDCPLEIMRGIGEGCVWMAKRILISWHLSNTGTWVDAGWWLVRRDWPISLSCSSRLFKCYRYLGKTLLHRSLVWCDHVRWQHELIVIKLKLRVICECFQSVSISKHSKWHKVEGSFKKTNTEFVTHIFGTHLEILWPMLRDARFSACLKLGPEHCL